MRQARKRRLFKPSDVGFLNKHHVTKHFYVVLSNLSSSTGWCVSAAVLCLSLHRSMLPWSLKGFADAAIASNDFVEVFCSVFTLLSLILGFLLVWPLSVVSSRPLNRPPGEQDRLVVTFRYCALLPSKFAPAARNDNEIKTPEGLRPPWWLQQCRGEGLKKKMTWCEREASEGIVAALSCWLLLRLMELKSSGEKSSRSKLRF